MRPTKSKFSEVEPLPCNEMEFGSGNLHTESLIGWQGASQVVQWKRICLPMQEMSETWVLIPESGRSPEKEMATHSSILAWEIPWTEEPGGLQFMGSQRVRYDWVHWVFVAVIGVVSSWWDWWAYSPRKRWELSPSLPCEDTIWTWPSASQEECSHQNSAIQSSWFGTSSLQNCEEINFWCWGHFFFFSNYAGGYWWNLKEKQRELEYISSELWPKREQSSWQNIRKAAIKKQYVDRGPPEKWSRQQWFMEGLCMVQQTLCPSLHVAEQPVTKHLFSWVEKKASGSSLKQLNKAET